MGPQKGRKAAAASAAHAASKRKSAAVDISADTEASVRELLAGLDVKLHLTAPETAAADAQTIVEIYEQIASLGFREQHIRRALQAVACQGVSLDAALDWLCLHLEPDELPSRLAGSARLKAGREGVKVLARAQAKQPATVIAKPDPAALAREQQQQRVRAEIDAQESRKQQAADAEWQRAWIKQYIDNEGESDSASDQTVSEDWELWGDPREIERRKAERKKASMPLEQRRAQLAEEWSRAKTEATRAKAAADQSRRKAAGIVIRDLKLEMKDRGISEEELEAMLSDASAECSSQPLVLPSNALEAEQSACIAGQNHPAAETENQTDGLGTIGDLESSSRPGLILSSSSSEGSAFELAGMFEEDCTGAPEPTAQAPATIQKPSLEPLGLPQTSRKGSKSLSKSKGKP